MTKPQPSSDTGSKRSNRVRPVAELLPEVGAVAFRKFGFMQHAVVSRWAEIVGARHAQVTRPERIRFPVGRRDQGVLTLTVTGAHAPAVQHLVPAIIERVNRFFGYAAVAKVTIKQGEVQRPAPVAPPPSLPPVPAVLDDCLHGVADPELRAALAALAAGVAAREALQTEERR